MSSLAPFRVSLWDINTAGTRGRGTRRAVIDDATDVGVSSYANDAGEMFFTIPMNHPLVDECVPLERHYEVSRLTSAGVYTAIGTGLLDDFDATKDEVIVYGVDYLGLLMRDIAAENQSYASTLIGTIIGNQWTDIKAQVNSPWAFVANSTINVSSRTVTVVTSFEARLSFWRGLLEILQSSGTTRPTVFIDNANPPNFSFVANRGSDKNDVRLEYSSAVLDFRYVDGKSDFAPLIRALGVKREGSTVLYSTQTYGSTLTYGRLFISGYWPDLINQAELDSRALSKLRSVVDQGSNLYVSLAQGLVAPLDGWNIADSVPVIVNRGLVQVDDLYTIWGWEWIGRRDGSENLFLDLLPKRV